MDLEKFFDWINRNILMASVAPWNPQVLRLIGRYLQAMSPLRRSGRWGRQRDVHGLLTDQTLSRVPERSCKIS